MTSIVKKAAAGAVLGGSLLFTGGMGLASAAPVTNINDGLVNVGIGKVNVLRDVDVAVAAQVTALLCGTDVNAAVLGAVDQGGEAYSCTAYNEPITITQNGPANSPNAGSAPGQQRG
jgi:hypothetical protein